MGQTHIISSLLVAKFIKFLVVFLWFDLQPVRLSWRNFLELSQDLFMTFFASSISCKTSRIICTCVTWDKLGCTCLHLFMSVCCIPSTHTHTPQLEILVCKWVVKVLGLKSDHSCLWRQLSAIWQFNKIQFLPCPNQGIRWLQLRIFSWKYWPC